MAVVESWYGIKQQYAPNAFLTYWSAFMGERMAMNKEYIKQQYAQMDPNIRAKEIARMRENIADLEVKKATLMANLEEQRSRGIREATTETLRIISDITEGVLRSHAAGMGAQATRAAALIAADTRLTEGERAERRAIAGTQPGDATRQILGATGKAVKAGRPEVTQYSQALQDAKNEEKSGDTGEKADRIAYEFYMDALANGHIEAANAIRASHHFQGADPQEVIQKYGPTSPEEQRAARQRLQQYGVGGAPKFWDVWNNVQGMVGTMPGMMGMGEPGKEGGPPTAGMAMLGPAIENSSVLAIDKQIEEQKNALANLMAQRQEKVDPFAAFQRSYIFETPFKRVDPERTQIARLLAEHTPQEVEAMFNTLAEGPTAGASERYAAEGAVPREYPHIQQVADGGDWVFRYFEKQLLDLSNTMKTGGMPDPQTLYRLSRTAQALPGSVRQRSPQLMAFLAGAEESLAKGDLTATAQALDGALQAAHVGRQDDIHMSEVVGDMTRQAIEAQDPRQTAAISVMLGEWSQMIDPNLLGDWSNELPRLPERVQRGEGPGLMRDLGLITSTAYQRADEETDYMARQRALAQPGMQVTGPRDVPQTAMYREPTRLPAKEEITLPGPAQFAGTVTVGRPQMEAMPPPPDDPARPIPSRSIIGRDEQTGEPDGWVFKAFDDGVVHVIQRPDDPATSEANPTPLYEGVIEGFDYDNFMQKLIKQERLGQQVAPAAVVADNGP